MPAIPIALAVGAGALGGFVLGKGVDGLSSTIKWTILGVGGFLVAKHLKVL